MRATLAAALLLSASSLTGCGDAVRERAEPGFQPFDPTGLDMECRFVSMRDGSDSALPVFVSFSGDGVDNARVNYSGEVLKLGSADGMDPEYEGSQYISYRIQEYGNFSVDLSVNSMPGEDGQPSKFEGTLTFVGGPEFVTEPIAGSCGDG